MADAARWIEGIETGLTESLTKAAHKAKPSAIALEAAPYVATFNRQARKFAAKAQALEAEGDHVRAVEWANHAARAVENLRRIENAINGISLTVC